VAATSDVVAGFLAQSLLVPIFDTRLLGLVNVTLHCAFVALAAFHGKKERNQAQIPIVFGKLRDSGGRGRVKLIKQLEGFRFSRRRSFFAHTTTVIKNNMLIAMLGKYLNLYGV
jgi:hypothetical protein